jgi:hypothetical protein
VAGGVVGGGRATTDPAIGARGGLRGRYRLFPQLGQVGAGGFHFGEDSLGAFEQLYAARGELYAASEAVEKAAVEFLLERLDRMADRRLCDKEFASGEREAANASQRGER